MKLTLPVLSLAFTCTLAQAEEQAAARVEITGSSIPQIESASALPLQIIRHQDFERAGITSTEQLMNSISANVPGAYNLSANQAEGFTAATGSHNAGASSANLRGLGPDSTLILLNGRRIADHGLNGSSADLNSIPFNAIERVEILKDGASALYGTDAIGGVINFILRSDFTGLEVQTSADVTQHGGGNMYSAALLFGQGVLESDDYNLMLSLAADKSTLLAGNQRGFVNGNQPARGLAPDTVGTPYATQVFPNGFTLPGSSQQYNYANLLGLQSKCASYPQMVSYPTTLWANPYRSQSCSYDYGADWALMQPVEHLNLVSRVSVKLDQNHTLHAELLASHTSATDQYTPLQIYGSGFNYPAGGPYYQSLSAYIPGYDNTQPINLRWRCSACGNREETTVSNTYRALLSLDGVLQGWDYKTGISMAGSLVHTDLVQGYIITSAFESALNTGLINPWALPGQPQTPAAQALIHGAEYTGRVYGGNSRLIQADGSASREWFKLPAGWVSSAAGFDVRRESYQFNANSFAASQVLFATSDPSLSEVNRDIAAVYVEALIPLTKLLQADLAVRHDHYSDFGGTTNPKISLRFQPSNSLMLRASWNSGFHAPDVEQMYSGQSASTLNNPAPDPLLCPQHPGNASYCSQDWAYLSGGNRQLKPETSHQWSAGMVLAPSSQWSTSIDYWDIKRNNRIASPDPALVLANYPGDVIRNADGSINHINADLMNIAQDNTKGIDLGIRLDNKLWGEQFMLTLDGTYLISHAVQESPQSAAVNYVGQFGDPNNGYADLYLRWRQSVSLTWKHNVWSSTLSEQYSSGYLDQAPVGVVPAGYNPNVPGYSVVNLGVAYTGFNGFTINSVIKNLFDINPPFSAHNVDNVAGAGWDARIGQARLRSFGIVVKYRFY